MSLDGRGVAWTIFAMVAIAAALTAFYWVRSAERVAAGSAVTVAGSPEDGREAIVRHGCGACHAIAGVRQARGKVGPPLSGVADRRYLGGQVINTPENMARWIIAPQTFAPGTAMPNLGVTEDEARDITAYLHSIR